MSVSSQQQLVDVKQRLQPSQTIDVRRAAFETLIGLSRCEDPKVKVQVGELLPQPFATLSDMQEKAIEAVYDLCEDEDEPARRSGYSSFALISRAAPSWVQRNTDVLSQLLAVDSSSERNQIRKEIGRHVAINAEKALGVVFDVLEDAEAGKEVKKELLESLVAGELAGSGPQWETAMKNGLQRVLSSADVVPAPAALSLFTTLSKLPRDPSSTTLASRIASYPSSATQSYAVTHPGLLELATTLPHDPRAIVWVHFEQLLLRPFTVPEPTRSWKAHEGLREKAFLQAVREWSQNPLRLQRDAPSPVGVPQDRWQMVLQNVVARLTSLATPLVPTRPLPFAALEFFLFTLFYLFQNPHVLRQTLLPEAPFAKTVRRYVYHTPTIPPPQYMQRTINNTNQLLEWFKVEGDPPLPSVSNPPPKSVFERFTPSWLPPSRPSFSQGPSSSTHPTAHLSMSSAPSGLLIRRGPPPPPLCAPEPVPCASTSRASLGVQPSTSSLLDRLSPTGWTPSLAAIPTGKRASRPGDVDSPMQEVEIAAPDAAPVHVKGLHYGKPGAIKFTMKGRGSVHAPPLPTPTPPSAPSSEPQSKEPSRSLLSRLGESASGSNSDADMDGGKEGGRSNKRKGQGSGNWSKRQRN